MNKEAEEAANEQYRNKFVFNQSGGSFEIDNTTGQEGIYITQAGGSNIKLTPNVSSEWAKNNKQTLVGYDSFETVRNDKCVFVGGDFIYRVVGNHSVQSGYTDDSQLEALKEWKEAYRPVAERNSQFEVERGGESFPNGVETSEAGERSDHPSKNQERYIVDDVYGTVDSSTVNSQTDEVSDYTTVNMPGPVFLVVNPNTEDFGEDINPATEGGVYNPTPGRQPEDFKRDIPKLQKKLTELEGKFGGGVANQGGDDHDFTFRNKVIMVGGEVNDYPSIRTVKDGRATPSRVIVGPQAGAFVEIEAVPHVEEVNNSHFPVGNYSIHAGNKYNINAGSGGVDIKTTGPVEVGGTTYKLAANKVNIQSSAGVNITSENLVELTSLKNISLRSNKQVLIEPGLGVKNNVIIGGSTYTEGETYLHHVTAPTEIQQTEQTTVFGKLLEGLEVDATFRGKRGTLKLKADSNSDKVECVPHSHHFKNLPLRLTDSSKSVRTIAIGENINTDGFQTPAQNIGHGLKEPTNEPTPPREIKPSAETLLPHDRDRVEMDGTIKPEFLQVEKQGSFAQDAPVTNEGIQVLEGGDSGSQ